MSEQRDSITGLPGGLTQPNFLQNRTSIGDNQQRTYDTESSLLNDRLLNESSFHEQMLEQNKIKGINDSIIQTLMNKRQGSNDKLRPRSSKGFRGTSSNSQMPVIEQLKNQQTRSEERTKSSQAARNLSSQKQKRETKERFAKLVQ
jgi:hypothetical protein